MTREELQFLLKKHRIWPSELRGQNFLLNDAVLASIVASARVKPGEAVLEIGPGIGNLTSHIARAAKQVVAVEVDKRFKPILDAICAVNEHVAVLYEDILSCAFEKIDAELRGRGFDEYVVIANIPYYITSRFIRRVFQYTRLPRCMILLVQKEVGERIVARPGDHSKLSLAVQWYGRPEIVAPVSRKEFYPAPTVDSVILRVSNIQPWQYPISEKVMWRVITFGFASKRRTLVNNLMAGLRKSRAEVEEVIARTSIDAAARAEDLSMQDWLSLVSELMHSRYIA